MDVFEDYIEKAIKEIKINDYSKAKKYIHLAILENDTSPKTHNLLGVIAELARDFELSVKHYRASCALDPTFKPACKNLERITSFYYSLNINKIDFGNNIHHEDKPQYFVKYDTNSVGHLFKKTYLQFTK